MFGGWELVLVVLVIFLIFGSAFLPKLARSLGESRKALKEGFREDETSDKEKL